MEQNNMPIVAKKFWKIVRVIYFMLRKGISKIKLLADLNIMMNRAKITGKLSSIQNLMFHHHHHASVPSTATDNHISYPVPLDEYEFNCSSTPAHLKILHHLPFNLHKRKHYHQAGSPVDDILMAAAIEMANSAASSPLLPGFGATPMVRQLRITDSPFPVREIEEDNHVDEAAEEFIKKFHKDLRQQQNSVGYLGYS